MTDSIKPATIAGFPLLEHDAHSSNAPLVFLHGSDHTEASLVPFARAIDCAAPWLFPRGRETTSLGFTFFRRHADRSIDHSNLETRTAELVSLLAKLADRYGQLPILVGFSSGAIIATSVLANSPSTVAGAVLLRPEKLCAGKQFRKIDALPVLIIAAEHDNRRRADDASEIFLALQAAGAEAELHVLDCGHGLDVGGPDTQITRAWLGPRG